MGPLLCKDSVTGTKGASVSLSIQPTCTEHLLRARWGGHRDGKRDTLLRGDSPTQRAMSIPTEVSANSKAQEEVVRASDV